LVEGLAVKKRELPVKSMVKGSVRSEQYTTTWPSESLGATR
jgi:hypothetical protein